MMAAATQALSEETPGDNRPWLVNRPISKICRIHSGMR